MLTILLILSTVILYVWRYFKNHQDFWKNRGIQGPDGKLVVGNYYDLYDFQNPKGLVIKEWTKKFGKVYGVQEGVRKCLIVSDVEMLQEMFTKKFDDFYGRKHDSLGANVDEDQRVSLFNAQGIRWKRLRTISASSFSSNSLKKIMPIVEDSAIELVRLLEPHVNEDPINIHLFFQEYTMDVISRIAMGQNGSKMFNNPMSKYANLIFNRNMAHPVAVTAAVFPSLKPFWYWLIHKIGPVHRAAAHPMFAQIYKTVDKRIAQREKDAADGVEPGEPTDFVDLFLDARAEGGDEIGEESGFTKSGVKISRVLTREEIVAQCFVFLLAGFDTTANALAYTSWLLAKHPNVLRKVQKEIDEECGPDQFISYESLSRMKYTENVMKEALRLFPLGSFAASRTAMKDTTLGGIPLEKGTLIQMDVWTLHYEKEIWGKDAEDFVPERWEDEKIRHHAAFLSFGSGPRVCIGKRLAYMEEKLALAHILRRFDIVAGPKTEENLRLLGSTTVSPEATTVYIKKRVF